MKPYNTRQRWVDRARIGVADIKKPRMDWYDSQMLRWVADADHGFIEHFKLAPFAVPAKPLINP